MPHRARPRRAQQPIPRGGTRAHPFAAIVRIAEHRNDAADHLPTAGAETTEPPPRRDGSACRWRGTGEGRCGPSGFSSARATARDPSTIGFHCGRGSRSHVPAVARRLPAAGPSVPGARPRMRRTSRSPSRRPTAAGPAGRPDAPALPLAGARRGAARISRIKPREGYRQAPVDHPGLPPRARVPAAG